MTDALGEIKEDLYDDLEPLPGWDAAGQRRFAVQVVAREQGLGEAEVERQSSMEERRKDERQREMAHERQMLELQIQLARAQKDMQ